MIAFLVIIIGSLLVTGWLEARDENGAAERASINRMADQSRKAAAASRPQRFTKYSKIGWTPDKRTGGKK